MKRKYYLIEILLQLGTQSIAVDQSPQENFLKKIKIILDESKYGFKKREKDIPDPRIAITSVLLANFDVNHITERKTKIGNKKRVFETCFQTHKTNKGCKCA